MARVPGTVMGQLAFAHPFLEGNGRTLLVVHIELARRAGMTIDWAAFQPGDYLRALTEEIQLPGNGNLDRFLTPHIHPNPKRDIITAHLPAFTPPPSSARTLDNPTIALRSTPIEDPATGQRCAPPDDAQP